MNILFIIIIIFIIAIFDCVLCIFLNGVFLVVNLILFGK